MNLVWYSTEEKGLEQEQGRTSLTLRRCLRMGDAFDVGSLWQEYLLWQGLHTQGSAELLDSLILAQRQGFIRQCCRIYVLHLHPNLNKHLSDSGELARHFDHVFVVISPWWLIQTLIHFHDSMQGNGMPWPRKIQKAFSFRTTSLLSTLWRKMAQWRHPPKAEWSFLGELSWLSALADVMMYWMRGTWMMIYPEYTTWLNFLHQKGKFSQVLD